ncbi:unnamed protein product [Caretta caretta]
MSQRRRKKRTWDEIFQEILQASATSKNEIRDWRITLARRMEKERVERRKALESKQEKEWEMHQDTAGRLRKQNEMLRTLVDLQVQQSHAHLPLQPIENSILGPPYAPP